MTDNQTEKQKVQELTDKDMELTMMDAQKGIDALQAGLAVIDAGHYGTEYIFMDAMKKRIQEVFDGLKVTCAKVQCPYTLMADL